MAQLVAHLLCKQGVRGSSPLAPPQVRIPFFRHGRGARSCAGAVTGGAGRMTDMAFHQWFIEPRENERQESSRGRRHAYKGLDPRRRRWSWSTSCRSSSRSPYCPGIVPEHQPDRGRAARPGRDGRVGGAGGRGAVGRHPRVLRGPGGRLVRKSGGQGELGTACGRRSTWAAPTSSWRRPRPARCSRAGPRCTSMLTAGITTLLVTGTVTNVCGESTARDASHARVPRILVADACAAPTTRTTTPPCTPSTGGSVTSGRPRMCSP